MDVSKEIVVKWTRYQRQKADEELLKKAKILKDQKNKRKNGSSEKPMPKRRSKNGSDEACSSDVEILSRISGDNSDEEANSSSGVEILDEQYIPPNQRRQLPRSRISKLHTGIAIDKTRVPCPGSKGTKKSQTTHKDNVASGNSSNLFSLEVSDEHDGGGSDNQSDTEGEENPNHERNVETDDSSSSASISESSSEEDGDESDDDYNVDESCNSGSDSDSESESESEYDDSSHYSEGKAIGGTTAATVKRNPAGENRKAGKFHLQKKRKLPADLDTGVGCGNEKDDDKEVRWKRKSQQELREKITKLDSDKISFDSDGNDELDGDGGGDEHLSQKSSRSRGGRKESNCKKHPSRAVDLMNILSDSIWEEGDALKEKLSPLKESVCYNDYYSLPLKFRFEDEEKDPAPASAENNEEQKEVDSLFAALEMGWIQDDIGSIKLSKEDNDNEDEDAEMSNPAENCRLGHHFLILDEKIGVICKYCRIVLQEMKHVLPDLKIPSRRRQEWYAFYDDKSSLSHEFQFGHSSSGDHHAFISDIEGPVLNIIPAYLRRQMYPHQLDGFQFLWKNIAGATMIEDLKTSLPKGGTGCIISHAPGTGKSFLTIVFLLTFMEVHPTCRPVIIAPLTMLRAWGEELKRWKVNIPFHNLNDAELSGEENVMAASIIQQIGSSRPDGKKRDRDYKRMVKLYSWIKDKKSILGIGYNLFEKLTGEHRKGNNDNNIAEKFRKVLLELPGVLILDEGHTPRNKKSLLWKTLTKVETSRRIILSGTPFQNNFDELYNTFYLANPKFVESISVETCKSDAKSKRNLAKGRWDSLTSLIDKNAVDAVEKLKAMMDPFVHVHKGNILQESLPGLRDTLILLNPTEMQKQLLPNIPDNILEKVYLGSLVSVHPFLVAQHDEFSGQRSMLEELELSPEAGVKTQFVIEMVRLSNARDEKVLIFSEFIDPLNFLMKQLISYFFWEEGKEVLYMDGKLEDKQRQWVINSFNARTSEAKVLLASTKACSEGISLVGASRVVLLDVVWNPSVERQAISRAYRLGQKKFVYIYRLVMSGTVEIEKFQRQAKKDRISELVFCCPFDHNNGDDQKSKLARNMSGDDILDAMVNHKNLSHIFEEILPQAKQSNVVSSQKL